MEEPMPEKSELEESLKKLEESNEVMNNVIEVLFAVFRVSIEQTNNDMQYFIERLGFYNQIGEALGDHLEDLTDAMSGNQNGKDNKRCQSSWKRLLETHQKSLQALQTTMQSYNQTSSLLLKKLD